jgi:hypothetical protein
MLIPLISCRASPLPRWTSIGELEFNGANVTNGQSISQSDINAGALTFTPLGTDNGVGYDSFAYKVNDGVADSSASATMTIDVTTVTINATEDTALVFTAGNFGFSDVATTDQLQGITVTKLASTGVLKLNGADVTVGQSISQSDISDGALTFTPLANENGVGYDSFVYEVNTGVADSSASSTLTINVTAVNDLPTAADKTVTATEDTALVFAVADFGFSDVDTSDQLQSITITTLSSTGTLTLDGSTVAGDQIISQADIAGGKLAFTPATNANGTGYDSFKFTVNDGTADSSASSTMTIDVTAVNDLPTAADKTVTATEDTAFVFAFADFGFSDVETAQLDSIAVTTLSSKGTLALNGSAVDDDQSISRSDIEAGNLKFTPATNANGTGYDSFKFTVNDGTADSSASSTMTIDVTAVNDLPTASDKTVTATEDTAFVFAFADFGFSDVETAQLDSIAVTTLSSKGTLALNGSAVDSDQSISRSDIEAGNLKFTPAANANGTGYDSFKFTVNDGTADSSASSTMTIDVTAVNDLPTASDKTVTATEDTAFVFALADFGFSDVETAQLDSIAVTTLSSKGTLALNGSAVDSGQSISRSDIEAGNLKFTPATNANGTGYDSFKFTVNDGTADSSASSTMTIDVTAVNDLPTASDKTVTATEDTAFVFALADFGFSDVETAQLDSIAVTTLSSKGTLALNGSAVDSGQSISRSDIEAGNLKFTPAANANGTGYDSFKFTVNDGTADSSASSTMTIDVTAVNDLPTAADKTVTATEDTAFVFALADFGFSDVDSGAQLQSIAVTTLSSKGTLALNGSAVDEDQSINRSDIVDGKLTFTPATNANGTGYDSFKFTVNDGTADSSASSTMTIDVTAVNDLPTASDKTVTCDRRHGVCFCFSRLRF